MPRIQLRDGTDDAENESTQLPEGWYTGHLAESFFQDFKNGNGVALVFDFIVKGKNGIPRRLKRFNTWKHKTSSEAEKWGHVAVKQLMRACGKVDADSTEECHNVPIEILVKVGEKYNEVKGYRKIDDSITKTGTVTHRASYPVPKEAQVDQDKIAQQKRNFDDDDVPF
jgi:hypothetical protein